jgi:hypothetical protein
MCNRLLFVTIVVAVALGQTPAPRKTSKPFVAKDYPAEKFRISKNEYALGEITVRVINVKNLGYVEHKDTPHYCSAWVEVMKREQLVKRFYYEDIEPVGFSFGAFVPKLQPGSEFVAIVKEGDYDGRLLLVNREGETVDLPGGFYFVTADKKYIISEYASDDSEPGLTVFDLTNQRIVLQPKDTPEIGSWYRDESGYFFMEYERPGHAQRLDLDNQRLVKIRVNANDLRNATKVRYDFDPRKKQDCVSAQH